MNMMQNVTDNTIICYFIVEKKEVMMNVMIEYNKIPGCSYSENVIIQESMNSCFMEQSETQQLLQLKQLIICGKLRGELPAGFLSCFRCLPNELIIKIW